MKASKKRKIRRSFVLSSAQMRQIYDILADHIGACGLNVECAGDISLKPSSMDDLLSINNVGSYKIKTLRFGEGWGGSNVQFSIDWNVPIEVSLEGEDDRVLRTSDRLEKALEPALRYRWLAIWDMYLDGEFRPSSYLFAFVFVLSCFYLSFVLKQLPATLGSSQRLIVIGLPFLLGLVGAVVHFLVTLFALKFTRKEYFSLGPERMSTSKLSHASKSSRLFS